MHAFTDRFARQAEVITDWLSLTLRKLILISFVGNKEAIIYI